MIPSSVIKIADYSFSCCNSLAKVYVNWNSPLVVNASWIFDTIKEDCILYVPQGTKEAYRSSDWGNAFFNIVEYDATGIANITTSGGAKEISRYSLDAKRLDSPTKGVNIVKYSDGSAKKVIVH